MPHPDIRIRERRAPRPRITTGVGGWARVSLVDRAGRERVVAEQHNLILNNGMDLIGDSAVTFASTVGGFFRWCHVGTSSTAPANTDTSLGTEIARTTNLWAALTQTVVSGNTIRYRLTYEFDFAEANGVLTEWGISRADDTTVHIRELFRDETDTPVAVTKTSDEKLRLQYTFDATFLPITNVAASMVVTGVGTLNGYFTLLNHGTSQDGYWRSFDALRRESFTTTITGGGAGIHLHTGALTWGGTAFNIGSTDTLADEMLVRADYTGGSHKIVWESARWSTGRGNLAGLRSIVGQSGGTTTVTRTNGWAFVWDEAEAWEKLNTHRLTLTDIIEYTWERA